jgi:DNA-binding CsgD family transcriptional regulator
MSSRSSIAAVRVVAAGDALIAPTITKRLIEQFARAAPPRTPPPHLERLTPRELEILTLIARGLSNGEIAGELVLSQATVKTHVKRILSKLDLRDRVRAVVLAYEAGLVTPGDSATRNRSPRPHHRRMHLDPIPLTLEQVSLALPARGVRPRRPSDRFG